MKTKLFLILPLVFVSAAQAAPGKPMVSQDGKCVATVPANWGPAVTGVGMQVPAGRSYARAKLRDGTMADYKALMTSMFKITKTFEDSAARYWIETGSQADDTMHHWSVAVPGNGGVCEATIGFDQSLGEAGAKSIALSVKQH